MTSPHCCSEKLRVTQSFPLLAYCCLSRLWTLPVPTYICVLSASVMASSSGTIFHFKALVYLEQETELIDFNILIVTVSGRWRGLRHMEVKCVGKDPPPTLIHSHQKQSECRQALECLQVSLLCLWSYWKLSLHWGAHQHPVGGWLILPSPESGESGSAGRCSTWYLSW